MQFSERELLVVVVEYIKMVIGLPPPGMGGGGGGGHSYHNPHHHHHPNHPHHYHHHGPPSSSSGSAGVLGARRYSACVHSTEINLLDAFSKLGLVRIPFDQCCGSGSKYERIHGREGKRRENNSTKSRDFICIGPLRWVV